MKAQTSADRARVLVIDDCRSIREFVLTLLRDGGFSVDDAPDAVEGLARIKMHEPDVILLDVEMPGISGLEMLDILAKKQRLYSVMMFTTHSNSEKIVEAFAKGADDYIVKPFKDNELLARVAAAERSVLLKRELALARCRADESLSRMRDAQAKLIEERKILAIGRLAAGLAHEINNPLGFIQSNLSTLSRYTDFLLNSLDASLNIRGNDPGHAADSADVDETLGVIDKRKLRKVRYDIHPLLEETREGLDRIAEIVRCFRNLEQGITGSRDIREEDLNDILSAILNVTKTEIPAGANLVNELDSVTLPVMGTVGMLRMALINLIRNAVEAVGTHGEIKVGTGRENGAVFCDITDSGPGIDDEIQHTICDPFFTTKTGHLGLGLTIAECFIHAHGGKIEVESDIGKGTRLRVYLPAATGPTDEIAKEAGEVR